MSTSATRHERLVESVKTDDYSEMNKAGEGAVRIRLAPVDKLSATLRYAGMSFCRAMLRAESLVFEECVMEPTDSNGIAERELERILAAAKSRNIDVTGTAYDGRITLRGFTTLTITALDANAFRVREDQQDLRGGQTRVTNQPPRWSESGPPYSLNEMRSIADRWLASELSLSRLPRDAA